MKLKLYNNIGNLKELYDLRYTDNYFKEENIYIRAYNECIIITELDNALKAGKTCKQYDIRKHIFSYYKDDLIIDLYNWLSANALNFKEFIILLKSNGLPENFYNEFNVRVVEIKGVRVFSPFVKVSNFKAPKKWNCNQVVRAILAGNILKAERPDGWRVYEKDGALKLFCYHFESITLTMAS